MTTNEELQKALDQAEEENDQLRMKQRAEFIVLRSEGPDYWFVGRRLESNVYIAVAECPDQISAEEVAEGLILRHQQNELRRMFGRCTPAPEDKNDG